MDEDLKDLISCPICLEEYHEPKALPCLHTFCKSCLTGLLEGSVMASDKRLGVFICPVCRRRCGQFNPDSPEGWINQLPSNHLIVNFKDKVSKNRPAEKHAALCFKHRKPFEYYCKNHDEAICSRCIIQRHRRCDDIIDIEQAWQLEESECSRILVNLDKQIEFAEEMVEKRRIQKHTLESQSSVAVKNIAELRETIITEVLKKEKYLTEKVHKLKEDKTKLLTVSMNQILHNIHSLKDTKRKMLEMKTKARRQPMLTTCLEMEEEILHIKDQFETQNTERTFDIVYHGNKEIKEFLTDKALGEIVIKERRNHTDTQSTKVKKSAEHQLKTVQAKKQESLNPKAKSFQPKENPTPNSGICFSPISTKDKQPCFITGAAFLHDNYLVLSDHDNGKIKLFDQMCDYQLYSEMVFNSDPWDVTVVFHNQVAVSFPDDNLVQILTFEDGSLVCGGEVIRTDGRSYGLSSFKEELAVCIRNKTKSYVAIFNMRTLELTWTWNSGQASRLSGMWYTTFDTTGQFILVADETNNYVTCISRATVNRIWTAELHGARAAVADDKGNIFVTSRKENSLTCISSNGQAINKILLKRNTCPDITAFDKTNRRLLLSEFERNMSDNKIRIITVGLDCIAENCFLKKPEDFI